MYAVNQTLDMVSGMVKLVLSKALCGWLRALLRVLRKDELYFVIFVKTVKIFCVFTCIYLLYCLKHAFKEH